jgi:hypothetical protein
MLCPDLVHVMAMALEAQNMPQILAAAAATATSRLLLLWERMAPHQRLIRSHLFP